MCCTGCSTPYDERATRIAGVTMWSAGSNNAIRRKSKADRWGGNVLCREQQSLPANVQRRSLGSQCGPHDATTSNGERAMRIAGGAMCFAGCDNAIRRTRNADRWGRNVLCRVRQRHPANPQCRTLGSQCGPQGATTPSGERATSIAGTANSYGSSEVLRWAS